MDPPHVSRHRVASQIDPDMNVGYRKISLFHAQEHPLKDVQALVESPYVFHEVALDDCVLA